MKENRTIRKVEEILKKLKSIYYYELDLVDNHHRRRSRAYLLDNEEEKEIEKSIPVKPFLKKEWFLF